MKRDWDPTGTKAHWVFNHCGEKLSRIFLQACSAGCMCEYNGGWMAGSNQDSILFFFLSERKDIKRVDNVCGGKFAAGQ